MDRLNKYKSVDNETENIDIKFDITELELFCNYICSDNKKIKRGDIINIQKLFNMIDRSFYNNDTDKKTLMSFIEYGIDARINNNLTSRNMILIHIANSMGLDTSTLRLKEINNDEVIWINRVVSETLKYAIIYNDIDEGISILTKFKSTDYSNRGNVVQEISEWVSKMNNKFRKSRANKSEDMMFSLDRDNFENSVRETHRQMTSASNRLKFGTQALNALTGGGVQSERVYILLGLPGEGKSSTLLDMALQLKRYNKNYVCKDPTKKPCIVLLIMENSVMESITRMYSMCTGEDIGSCSEDEAINRLYSVLNMSEDDPINLVIKFRPNLSEDTSYLYTLCDDLEDDGYEVICVLQDYLKRIRSANNIHSSEIRLEYGDIVNEFKTFATIKQIPLISASQLNRTATASIDEARIKNKADLVRLIGRANVGESNLILENGDWIAIIAPEYDDAGARYLGIQGVKSRDRIPEDFHIAFIPYINGTIKLIEDYYEVVPSHKVTMRQEIKINGINTAQGLVSEIKDISEFSNINVPSDSQNGIFKNAQNSYITCKTSNFIPFIQTPKKKEMCKIITR